MAICLAAFAAVLWRAGAAGPLGPQDWNAARFTVLQAALSAVCSLCLAIPLARALARRDFPGRGILMTVMGAPFILPVIVASMGLILVLGRNGWISDAFAAVGLPRLNIYGLHGVVIAHVFFNLPLATRLLLQGWAAIPAEHHRLAALLGLAAPARFRLIEWPMLRRVVPGALALIFLICTTSFTVALLLGGGPRASTIELAIYQAFRFEFDLAHASSLAALQTLLGLAAAALAYLLRPPALATHGRALDRAALPRIGGAGARWIDRAIILFCVLFLVLPILAIAGRGLFSLRHLDAAVIDAALRSLLVASMATVLALALALPMVAWAVRRRGGKAGGLAEVVGFLTLSVSPLVLGTGIFLLLNPILDPVRLALPVTALVNAALALPFVMQAILPHHAQAEADLGPLADHLGLAGRARWRWVLWPRLRAPIGFAAGLTAAFSVGDLGVIALFADPSRPTLPLHVYQLMGSYRTDAAEAAVLILMALTLGVFWMFDRGGRLRAGT